MPGAFALRFILPPPPPPPPPARNMAVPLQPDHSLSPIGSRQIVIMDSVQRLQGVPYPAGCDENHLTRLEYDLQSNRADWQMIVSVTIAGASTL